MSQDDDEMMERIVKAFETVTRYKELPEELRLAIQYETLGLISQSYEEGKEDAENESESENESE